jgi:hypothetical protein
MSGCQAGGKSCGSCTDDDDIPIIQMLEVQIRAKRLDVEIRHGNPPLEAFNTMMTHP